MRTISGLITGLFLVTACAGGPATTREKGALTGAVIGAGTGAIIGSQTGNAGAGAAIGSWQAPKGSGHIERNTAREGFFVFAGLTTAAI